MWRQVLGILGLLIVGLSTASGQQLDLQLRNQLPVGNEQFERRIRAEKWSPTETAIIVCDVWDKHHCLNAVRRMEEFLPRMNDVLTKARDLGVVIIHSPSDCMPAYEGLAPRTRAINAPKAATLPKDVEFWCSKIPAEEEAVYPIDQSDGGEDDDPEEHARWAAELKALGRNPGMPWKTQNPLIEIDNDRDFISDRGDEVWNILESNHIKNVILVGVHTNMCVLGRPFGLRQMARNDKHVVLMRDLTDCMYNPKRWPFVDHFTGNDLIVSHVERYVCPTITSDQLLGGTPFESKYDTRTERDLMKVPSRNPSDSVKSKSTTSHWKTVDLATQQTFEKEKAIWLRCTVRVPADWMQNQPMLLRSVPQDLIQAWLNGKPLEQHKDGSFEIPGDAAIPNDINLLVLRIEPGAKPGVDVSKLVLRSATGDLSLSGKWQLLQDNDPSAHANIPLPAKFGIGSDILFETIE